MEKLRKLYIDLELWEEGVSVDDFLIAIGKKQSNSVYHIAEISSIVPQKNGTINRYYIKVLKSDLITAIKRDSNQKVIPIYWYPRAKNKEKL